MTNKNSLMRRQQRVRTKLARRRNDRARLSVHRSGKHIYAQIIDDTKGHTLVSASTLQKDVAASLKSSANIEAAKSVGRVVAERALALGLSEVVFDRGGYLFHGRVKALADAAREAGLQF
jgi:large subunit ribosomal protein L18